MKTRYFWAAGGCWWLGLTFSSLLAAEEILFEENFNDDGEGSRYISEGRFVSELEDHAANGIAPDQVGPVYWAHSSEVSLVGVPGPTAERRAVVTWHHDLEAEQVTEEGMAMMEGVIAWLTRDKASLRVLFSPAPVGPGDQLLVDMITAKGGTVTGDEDTTSALPPAANYDLVIHSSQGAQPSRFTNYPVPYLTFNGPDHDDELVGTIGLTVTQAFPDIDIKAAGHAAAGGQTGSIPFFVGEVTVDTPGLEVPDGSTVVATYPVVDIPPVTSLADVEAMATGAVETVVDEGSIPVADMESGDGGSFSGVGGDNAVPGGPVGSFATVSTGTFSVKTAGTYGFALWVTGGARLRVDLNGNGLDAGDTVITQDTPNYVDGLLAGSTAYGDVTFSAAGEYAFEWVAYSPTDVFGAEVYFTFTTGAGQRDPVEDQEKWAPLADWEAAGIDVLPINLNGEIAVTKYEQPAQVIEERPLVVAINGPSEGGQVFGGGAFIDFEGDGFFAGSALNKFETETDPKTITLNPVDLTGQSNLKLKVLLAATTLDFETSDYLDIKIDPNNSGTFQNLIHFTAPTANDKFFSDGTTDLNIAFQEVTYDLPEGITNLVIRVEALTTWWNEVVALDHIRVVREVEPEFTELWLLGDDSNGNQSEFSQEQGMDAAPGSAIAQDDDFYFRGIYPLPIGPVEADEPFLNYDRAHVPGDPFNRIHFNLDADSAATDTLLRMTFALCCFGAAEGGPSEHDMVFRLNGKEFFSEAGVNGDRVIQETVTAGDYDVVEGANTIEIERTGGSASAWVQYDYVRLEATAGAPVSPPDGGGGGVEPDEPGTLPADSLADFGGPAVDNGWTYGYRNLDLADRTQDYDPNQDFIPFSADWWTGSQWDEPNVDGDNVPWTQLGPENTHPNGDNNGELHWTIRRWTSPGGNTEITWHLAKENLNCGNGVTGAVHVNGVRVDGATIASDDGVGVTRSITVALQRGDVVDLIHSPLGTDDTDNDGCDGSLMSMGFKAAEGGGGGGDALYAQDFNAHANDTADLGDGSIIASNDGTNSVQDGALRMTQAGVNGTAASFVLPPFDASTGWQATFDFVVEHSGENTPADGFSFNYGAIPAGENFGDPAEEGYGAAVPHVSFQVDTWLWNDAAGQDAGVGIELSGTELALTKAADDNANFKPNERVSASATLSWDPVQGASFTTTGLRTNADFLNVATPGFTGEAGYGFSILARTGGHNETVIIDNLVITALSAGPGTVPPHLLGYWPADEGSGSTVADVTGQGLDGTLNEGAWGTGIRGGAFDLSGADGGVSHVAVPPTGATFEEITIAGWINGAPTGDWTGLIQARGGAAPDQPIGIGFRGGTGNLAYTWNDNNGNTWDFDSGLAIPPNQWAFVALSLTPEGATLYVGADGQLQSATNAIAHLTQINANTSWYFGKDNCCGDARNFDGLMDEIALWDTALTEAELTTLFNGTETPLTLIPGGGGGPGPANFILQDVGLSAEGAFQLTIPAGLSADIEYSTDLIQWEVIATGLDGTVQETDAGRLTAPQGYYRARQ